MHNQILVTGAAGFIGSAVSMSLLTKGYQVIGIDSFDPFYSRSSKEKNLHQLIPNSGFRFVEMDITHPAKRWPEIKADAIIHLAAKAGVPGSILDVGAYLSNNILGTQQVLDWMVLNGCQNIVFASSSSVYGQNSPGPFKETETTDFPISPYATTKKAGELLLFNYHAIHKINVLICRYFSVYGPRQRPDLVLHKFTKLILQNQPIPVFGNGLSRRDYTHISDIVSGTLAGLQHLQNHSDVYEIFNLGSGNPITLLKLIETIYTATGKKEQIQYLPPQQGDMPETFADIEKAKLMLNYNPGVGIEEGVASFLSWFKNENPSY
jgi:UDP-glucuronate 4-epimerase